MGFPDLSEEAGIKALNSWLATRSYIESYSPSQADVACLQAINSAPSSAQYPHAARWYNHIVCYEAEFSALAGDAAKSFKDYGPGLANAKDDGADFSGSDGEDDAEATRIREQRLADYKARKAAKPKMIAKSVVILDIKPWDDETDMAVLEAAVRSINRDGLVWGTSKLIAVGYGIKKLQLNAVVEDDKISTQDLQDEIEAFDEHVQSSDIVTFQKL